MFLLPENLEKQLSLASLPDYQTTVFEHWLTYVPNVRSTRCNLKNDPVVKK